MIHGHTPEMCIKYLPSVQNQESKEKLHTIHFLLGDQTQQIMGCIPLSPSCVST